MKTQNRARKDSKTAVSVPQSKTVPILAQARKPQLVTFELNESEEAALNRACAATQMPREAFIRAAIRPLIEIVETEPDERWRVCAVIEGNERERTCLNGLAKTKHQPALASRWLPLHLTRKQAAVLEWLGGMVRYKRFLAIATQRQLAALESTDALPAYWQQTVWPEPRQPDYIAVSKPTAEEVPPHLAKRLRKMLRAEINRRRGASGVVLEVGA